MPKQSQRLIPRSLLSFPLARFPGFWEDMDAELQQLEQYQTHEPSGLSVAEDKDHVFVEAAMPGLHVDDIEITLDKGILFIKGKRKESAEDEEKKYHRRANTSFSYRVTIPGRIDESKEPAAEYKNGLMTISFVKANHAQGKKIKIKK